MARSVVTPLQLTVAAGMLQNQGLKPLPAALQQAIATYNATTVVSNWLAAVNFYKAQSFFTETTFDLLLSIGSTVCPALGNSIPASPVGNYPNLIKEYLTYNTVTDASTIDPSGFSWLIEQTGSAYLGDGDYGKFTQGFSGVQGYISTVNDFINSSVNANEYLGPTFTNMDSLITGDISTINTNLNGFAFDLTAQGQLVNLGNLDLYGTPAGVLQQFNHVAKLAPGTVSAGITNSLINVGLTTKNISDLVSDNRFGLFNQTGLTANEFDTLQKLAYNAMTTVTGTDLAEVLDILDITTPNITNMAQLLDPLVMFPNSYSTMQTASPDGPIPIFGSTGSVNSNVAPVVAAYLPTDTGCDELGKIIPPADAVANKAIQVAFQQVKGIATPDLPEFAQLIKATSPYPWNINDEYLPNDFVTVTNLPTDGSSGGGSGGGGGAGGTESTSTVYQAQQDVPAGVDITDTDYWLPTTLGGLNTTTGLPLITAQTTPVDSSVTNYFDTSVATGTGPNGVITTYDVLGLAIDNSDFAARLATATTAIDALQTAGSLNTLNTAYTNILLAANDAAVLTQITNANNAIAALSASPYVTTLNTAWTYMANIMNIEKGYQNDAGIDYFNLQPNEKVSIYGFVQNLSQYAQLTAAGDANQFLQNIADTTTLTGQAIVASMREANNSTRIVDVGIGIDNQIPSDPPLDPIPAVVPVN